MPWCTAWVMMIPAPQRPSGEKILLRLFERIDRVTKRPFKIVYIQPWPFLQETGLMSDTMEL